jgi:hypothetical protein
MNSEIRMHDVIALLEDTRATHFETGKPLLLRRGQMGTVVMTYDAGSVEVEFSLANGQAYAILPVKTENLIVLRQEPELAPA